MGLRNFLDYIAPRTVAPTKATIRTTPNFRWMGHGNEVRIGPFSLLNPLLYIYDSRRGGCNEPAAIDLALPASSVDVLPMGRELSYWPNYAGLQPHQRGFYLQWLALDRNNLPPELGYAFLFFYNLERRALIDREDIRLITNEVLRLRHQYATSGQPPSGSWEGYSGRFLWVLLLAHKESLCIDDVRSHAMTTAHWTEDNLAAVLFCLILRNRRLTASLAFSIAGYLPQSTRSVVQRRVPAEFEVLFKKRFREDFSEGMEIGTSANKRLFVYRPASNVLSPLELSFPDPLGLKSQFKPLSKIWNACIEDLKKLGTMSRTGAEPDDVKRWEALPEELRVGADHPLTDKFCKLVESHTNNNEETIIPIEELAAVLDSDSPVKLTASRSRHICQMTEQIGYFLETDARLTGRAYRSGESVIAFLKMSTAPIDSSRYGPAACMLQFGFLVAASDGCADDREIAVISQHIEAAFELQEDEVRRMERLRILLQKTGPNRALLRRLVRGLKKPQRQAIVKLLIAIVLADGVVTRAERKALKGASTLLSIEFSEIEALLPHEKPTDEPITVRPAESTMPGERLPPVPGQSLALDRTAIAAILAETRDVAQILAHAMANSDDVDEHNAPENEAILQPTRTNAATSVALDSKPIASSSDLPPKYLPLYRELIAQDRWSLPDAETLAHAHGLMLAGAIDFLNEWAMEAGEGQIFYEDAEFLVIERSLLPDK